MMKFNTTEFYLIFQELTFADKDLTNIQTLQLLLEEVAVLRERCKDE